MASPNELREQGFIIINAHTEAKCPVNHKGIKMFGWETKTYEELGRLYNPNADGFGIRCGVQQNGKQNC